MKLKLPNVTLVCVDTLNVAAGFEAMQNCMKHAQFGSRKYFSLFPGGNTNIGEVKCYNIPALSDKEDYSSFIFFNLHQYIKTDFVMICQHDGYVVNPAAWSPEFLQYDYIGAPWWYEDGMNVGNGGFSIRSLRLMKYLFQFDTLSDWQGYHPEDDKICRAYRPELEAAGFTFAPEDVAARFSWEGSPKYPQYNNAFGFHGGMDQKLKKHLTL